MNLSDSVSNIPMIGPTYVRRLKKLNIDTVTDLIHHVPHRYSDYRSISSISKVRIGETVTIRGKLKFIKNQYTKTGKQMQLAEISDSSGSINVIWFNQPYLLRVFKKDDSLSLSGKVGFFSNKKSLTAPEYEKLISPSSGIHTGRLVPIFPGTQGISSKWLRSRIAATLPLIDSQLDEFLPKEILDRLKLTSYRNALKNVHYPKNKKQSISARQRLAFNELLMLHLESSKKKTDWGRRLVEYKLTVDQKLVKNFINQLPFKLTNSQIRSVNEINTDLNKTVPMNRLLEGDVGSGKTVVAAIAALTSFQNGFQTVFMAPTQILAQQHYETLKDLFSPYKARVSLVTSTGVKKDLGRSDIFVGTHALIHKKVDFDKVALVIIDEQQRFGVEQRAHLTRKTKISMKSPHVLTMTATPIPRTIALTLYGDLDLSTLDELPKGRKPIKTWLVPVRKRGGAYEWIEKQIVNDGVQAFVICPLIEESEYDILKQVKTATKEAEKLKSVFAKLKVGLLHGRLKSQDKNRVLDDFRKNKIHILVSTPVVEVGIDIPNATIMIIEAAERFGLAQLHQLRGRVGRGDISSYCLLFTESRSKKVTTRLNAMQKTLSGFELAELDLKLRGPGEIFGTRQSGFPELKIASWNDSKLIKESKVVSQEIIKNPKKYFKLLRKVKKSQSIAN